MTLIEHRIAVSADAQSTKPSKIVLPPISFSHSIPNTMSKPITRDDLDQAVDTLRGETKQLRADMETMSGQLCSDMETMGGQLCSEVGQLRTDMGAMETRLVH